MDPVAAPAGAAHATIAASAPQASSAVRMASADWSAAAVDDDPLAGDRAGALGGNEAHGVGDVLSRRDVARRDRVDRDPERRELARPARGEVGPLRLEDLGVDLDDAP